ncbi:MAG TPA: ABC transporter substrate-binding protein [Pseudolabrys sp.]|jgi:branched-chain amino acid transport system substrate-binding protein|nr:ABC transporter substrate-binding protein [Pseudolabrys sp.]
MSRRALLKAGVAMSVLPAPAVFAQNTELLKIGFLTVLTGPLAAGGKQQEEGAALFLKERNGVIAGRKVQLVTQDTAGSPALAKTKLQELVEREKVQVSIGPLATNEALAMDSYVKQSKVPLITTTSAATVDLKSRAPNQYVLHAFGTAPQVTYPLGDYAAKDLKFKKICIVAEDFTYGHEGAGGFQLGFEGAGGKIVQKLWPPLNAPEYGVYLAQIKPDVDAIYTGFAGSNPLRFLKAFSEFGLKGKVAVLGNTTMTDEGILKVMGNEAVGVYTGGWYAAGLDTPDNKKFVAGINQLYHHDPGFYTAGPYTALLIIEEALKTTKGKTDDSAAFLKAMREVQLDHGPIGPVRLDEYGTPVLDIYIRKVARVNGKLTNTIIKKYPQVSQFWTIDPKKAVQQPVFSRDYPPSKYLE